MRRKDEKVCVTWAAITGVRKQEAGDRSSGGTSHCNPLQGVPDLSCAARGSPQFAHSYRKAAIGSMDEARCAGTRHAADATAISSNMTPSRISGSRDAPGDHFAMTLFRIRLKITPATKPPPTLTVADLNARDRKSVV